MTMCITDALVPLAIATIMLAGCQAKPETKADAKKSEVIREISVPTNATISVAIGADGTNKFEVTIPEGHPHAGTYSTTSSYLYDDLSDAKRNLGRPGAAVEIRVNEDGEIVTVTNTTTMQ